MHELLETLRAANVAVTIVTAAALGIRINDLWTHLDRGRRLLFVAMVGFPATAAYGSWEALAQNAPPGGRTVLVTLTCLLALTGLWLSRHQHPYPRR